MASAMDVLGSAFKSPTFPTTFPSSDSTQSNILVNESVETEKPISLDSTPEATTNRSTPQPSFNPFSLQKPLQKPLAMVTSPLSASSPMTPTSASSFLNPVNISTLLPVKSIPYSISFYETVLGFSLISNSMDLNAIVGINGNLSICLRSNEYFPSNSLNNSRKSGTAMSSSLSSDRPPPLSPSALISQLPPVSPILPTSSLPSTEAADSARGRSSSNATLMDLNNSAKPTNPTSVAVRRSSSINRSKAATPPPPPPRSSNSNSSTTGQLSGLSFLVQCSGSLEVVKLEIERRLSSGSVSANGKKGEEKEKKWEGARLMGGVESKVSASATL